MERTRKAETKGKKRGTKRNTQKVLVTVSVYDHKGAPLPASQVSLQQRPGEPKRIIRLTFDEKRGLHVAKAVAPGRYLLKAGAKGLKTDTREVKIGTTGLNTVYVLGKPGMPFYYRGKVRIPFDPYSDLVAVAMKPDFNEAEERKFFEYASELKLKREKVARPITDDGVRVFRFPARASNRTKARIQDQLAKHKLVEYVGPLVYLSDEGASFLTNDIIVKFKSHVSKERIPAFAERFDLIVLRHIPYAGNAYQMRVKGAASYQLLDICEEYLKTGDVEYAEPDLYHTAVEDQINPTDYLYPEQWHHALINTPDAWQTLNGLDPNLTFGSANVIIAVVDSGVDTNHEDFNGNVTSGDPKIYELFDFANMLPHNNFLASSHGTGCAGAATAQAENASPVPGEEEGTGGVAGNCRLIGVRRRSPESKYSDMYIWLAGYDPNSTIAGFPPPISPGADIISNSIGHPGAWAVASGLMTDTFDYLTTYGRNGKGTLLFFSVGNYAVPMEFTLPRSWAAYEKTFAIGASTLANDGTTEEISAYSGFGGVATLDLCAPSHDEYVGGRPFHNPPQNYGAVSCDRVSQGNLPGHPASVTALTAVANPAPLTELTADAAVGDTVLNVASNAGFAVNQWIRLAQHGHDNPEWVQITAIPAGGVQLTVTPLADDHDAATLVFGASTLDVASTAGFVVGRWLLLEEPGQPGAEACLIRQVMAGAGQIEVAGPVNNHAIGAPVIGGANDYRNSFGGTSFSTPVCAGVAALVLSANPELSWVQVRQILRDTAEQIDLANANPIGQWIDTDFDGVDDYSRWYGFGRVDAAAAVQEAVNLIGIGPLAHIDTWIKENDDDVGDVPSLPPYSPDVWVRNTDPAVDDPAHVEEHQRPIRDQDNWVYVNVRNRGAVDSNDLYVRIMITRWAGTQYVYPDDFIPTVPPGEDPVLPLEPGTYLIDELHIESVPAGGVVTLNTLWPAALVPPASVTIDGVVYSWADACLLVDVSPHDGPAPTGDNTWDNNNICQRNVFPIDPPADEDDAAVAFVVGHRTNYEDLLNLRIIRRKLPPHVKLYFDYVDKRTGEEVETFLKQVGKTVRTLKTCELKLLAKTKAELLHAKDGKATPVVIEPDTRITLVCYDPKGQPVTYDMRPAPKERGGAVFTLPTANVAYVPVPREKGKYQVVALRAKGLKKLEKGDYQIDVHQHSPDGTFKGGVNFVIRKR